jgi:hypothetical protein
MQLEQQDEPGLALDQGADRAGFGSDDEVALRKTLDGLGGSGVAEVALRLVANWE